MKFIQKVTVKQVLTERSKELLRQQFLNDKQRLMMEREQLLFEQRKMEKLKKQKSEMLNRYFEKEMNSREEKVKLLTFQLEQLDLLPYGSHIKEKEIEALVDISLGDNWHALSQEKVILVEDGIIIQID